APAIHILFERKDHEHPIRDLPDRRETPGPPRPDLRADVIDDRNAETLDAPREPEIEVREIDDDERIRPLSAGEGDEFLHRRHVPGKLADPLRQSGHSEVAIVVDE